MDESKPFVTMCSYCQKEFPEVDKAVRASQNTINFSHGICKRHLAMMYKQLGWDDAKVAAKVNATPASLPDLGSRPDLVKAYSHGIFTQQQAAALKERLESSKKFLNRIQSLANIRS